MKSIVEVANDMIKTLKNCSPLCYQNYTHNCDYDSFSFQELLTLIMTYRTFKRKYENSFISVHINQNQCNPFYNCKCYVPSFVIRAHYGSPNPYEPEYDHFLIRYISEKFDMPIYLVNSYIKIYYFVDYFDNG